MKYNQTMKGIDIFIVRFLPFILFIIFGINVLCAYFGCHISDSYNLHGNSTIYASSLFAISLCNNKYHCKWNRAMYLYLIIIPIFNYLDCKLNFVRNTEYYLMILNISYLFTAAYTAFMAIRHFIQASKRRMADGR